MALSMLRCSQNFTSMNWSWSPTVCWMFSTLRNEPCWSLFSPQDITAASFSSRVPVKPAPNGGRRLLCTDVREKGAETYAACWMTSLDLDHHCGSTTRQSVANSPWTRVVTVAVVSSVLLSWRTIEETGKTVREPPVGGGWRR